MKKALVITPKSIYDVNGTSNYAYKLILLLINRNWEVHSFYYFKSHHLLEDRFIDSSNLIFLNKRLDDHKNKEFLDEYEKGNEFAKQNINNNVRFIKRLTNVLNEKFDLNSYDLILDCTNYQNVNVMRLDKYFFIQQFEYKWYEQKKFIENGFNNPFKFAKNLVLYDKYQLNEYNKNQNYFFNPLSSYNQEFILNNSKNVFNNLNKKYKGDIVYIGRINNIQKNIVFINEMNEKYGTNIQEYGPIEHNTKTTNYKGKLSRTEIIKVLNNAKYCIIVSNTEGFSYSIVEAISLGVPVIIRNTYPSAKFLTSHKNGFLIDKDLNAKLFAQEIDKIKNLSVEEYSKLVKNCIDFAYNELSTNEFEKRWMNIIEKN